MNFSAISSIQDQTQELSKQREQKSFEQCKKGFEFLAAAEKGDFKDKSLLTQACDAFASAIAQQRHASDPYFGMGYLLFLLKDYPASIRYLTEALQMDPEHPDAKMLLENIKLLTRPRPATGSSSFRAKSSESKDPAKPTPDFDQLYDEIEALVHAEVRDLMSQSMIPPVASVNKAELLALKDFVQRQQKTLNTLLLKLKIVDEEIDTDDLRGKLKTVESLTRRYENALDISKNMLQVKAEMNNMNAGLEGLKAEIEGAHNRNELSEFESTLENILDRCDQIADQLDEWDQAHHPVNTLVEMYESLVAEIDQLNEIFDDCLDHLKS